MAREQRRLAAIVSADVVGYSRLMGFDEDGTLASLRSHLRELINPKIAEYGGRTVKSMGDGLLLEFASAVDAVRCAVDVQRSMADRNATVPDEIRIVFRIGINVGDIIIDGEDIFGDKVNVAARLQTLAEPGGICVSRVVRDQVLDKLNFTFENLGAQAMKNIARPIEVYRVAVAGLASAGPSGLFRRSPAHEVPSIAVLPFVNRSRDEEDEYFADGLADELLNVLAKIRGLRVAARSSAFTFKGKGATVAEVGQALNVATVLEGSVRKAGDRMRISVQLVKVADGYQMWAESYDRTLEDIFAVQDDIALSVVKELRSTLLGETLDPRAGSEATAQVAAAVKGRSSDPEAYRLFLQARHLIERLTRDDTANGIEHLKAALDRDPAFALAWVELGRAYGNEVSASWAPLAEGPKRAREAVMRALALEPELAEAHAELAWIRMLFDWDWPGAETSCARALELAPGSAVMLRRAGDLASIRGRFDEAIALYRRAIEQDPLSAAAHGNLGFAFDAAGRLAEGEQALRRALLLAPHRSNVRALLARNLLAQGRNDEALAEALRESEEWARLWALAIIHHAAARPAEADAALRELISKYAEGAAYQVAEVYAARGETDLAFQSLERAYGARDSGLSSMRVEPLLVSLHVDPRWNAFLRKMGLAD